jgi:hypothetical protein
MILFVMICKKKNKKLKKRLIIMIMIMIMTKERTLARILKLIHLFYQMLKEKKK